MYKKSHKKGQKSAFSLIELSIVILIVSILITGSLGISKTALNNTKTKITNDRMNEIYSALTNFVAKNRRLPCPALLTTPKGDATYGNETATPGTCTSSLTSSFTTAPVSADNLVYGMLPLKALGLDPDVAEDGWGTKFSYVVDKRFTRATTSLTDTASGSFELSKSAEAEDGVLISNVASTNLIDIQGPSDTSLLPDFNALFVLISHGANKFYGYNATGTAQNGVSTVADEISNGYNATTMDARFIAYSTDAGFDDFVLFKTKSQLIRDAGLEFIICPGLEAQVSGTVYWATANTGVLSTSKNYRYGCIACSALTNNRKTCMKYGVWSANDTAVVNCTVNTATNCL